MGENAFDIAMKFVMKGGDAVWAESTLGVAPGDPFMQDFDPITDYADYSNFFEVQTFDFALNVKPDDAGSGHLSHSASLGAAKGGAAHAGAANAGDPFERWRSATEAEARRMKFELSFDSFSFTRVIDGASPLFFQHCSRQKSFESAALVKRVATGARGGIERQSFAFMRIDFTDVLFKSVKWSDGDLVTEKCEFVCDSLSFQYRQQRADGSLLAPTHPAVWDRKKDSERKRQASY